MMTIDELIVCVCKNIKLDIRIYSWNKKDKRVYKLNKMVK